MSEALLGKRVLVVEDEPLIGMLLEELLLIFGAQIVGPITHLDQALRLAQAEPLDAAILDVHVDGRPSFAVADILDARGLPYLFATGYGRAALAARYEHIAVLEKPYRAEQLHEALTLLLRP